ncbi:MAG: sigma-70 family RNA polymerase sigma factor [Sedimentisphaerales bacterium]|nr:sigma-70 family RNA polymerase sigma factor [Sedimentisphaerales bacterium]
MREEEENITHDPADDLRGDQFVRSLLINEKRIYAFILTLVFNRADAEDIMQDTASVMWRKYKETDSIADFAAWGIRIAHYKVLEFRKKQYKKKQIQFNPELFEEIVGGAQSVNDELDARMEALRNCLTKLGKRERRLLMMRHEQNATAGSVAKRLGISTDSVYKALPRIHDILLRCIRRTLISKGLT